MDLAGMLEHIHRMVWGPWTLAVFLGVGIYFSIRFGFFQVRGGLLLVVGHGRQPV